MQLAVALGAQVTALTRPASMELVRSLGAERVLDHSRVPFDAETGDHDVVLDAGGNLPIARLRRMVVPGGRVVLAAAKAGDWIAPVGRMAGAVVTSWFSGRAAISFLAKINTADLAELAAMAGRGQLVPPIDECYPFDRTPEAIGRLESGGVRGKLVIRIR